MAIAAISGVRSVGLALASVTAWLVFAVGLIAPLTPSEGMPHPTEILIFVGLPVSLLVFVGNKARTPLFRVASWAQALVILGIAGRLLGQQAGLW
jgi:hypothetical protein